MDQTRVASVHSCLAGSLRGVAVSDHGDIVRYIVTIDSNDEALTANTEQREVGCTVEVSYESGESWKKIVLADNELEAVSNAFLFLANLLGGKYALQ